MEGKWCVRGVALISLSTVAVVAQRSCPAGEKTLTIRMTAAGTTADGSKSADLVILLNVLTQPVPLLSHQRVCMPLRPIESDLQSLMWQDRY